MGDDLRDGGLSTPDSGQRTNHMRAAIVVLSLVLVSTSVARGQSAPGGRSAADTSMMPSVTLPPDLDRVLRDYERAWRARDAAALAALFTPDGFVMRPGSPPVRGREAIERAYAGSGGPLRLRALAYAADDTVGYIIGAFAGSDQQRDAGKFILPLRRATGGPWMIAADMDNGNSRR